MKKLLRKWRRWKAGRRLAKVINGHHAAYRVGYEDGKRSKERYPFLEHPNGLTLLLGQKNNDEPF